MTAISFTPARKSDVWHREFIAAWVVAIMLVIVLAASSLTAG